MKKCFVFLIMLSLASCEKLGLCHDDSLSLNKQSYAGTELKINGYYIKEKPSSAEYTSFKFLCQNGIVFAFGNYNNSDSVSGKFDLTCIDTITPDSDAGLFCVSGTTIEIECWTASISGCSTTFYEKGEITSDSTFVILRQEFRKKGKASTTRAVNEKYHFIPR